MKVNREIEKDLTSFSRDRRRERIIQSRENFGLARKKRVTKVFGKIEGLYSRGRYLGGVRKFEKYKELSRRI